jgi:ABC-type multidrug transport system fused ATPase/permease subunit
VVGPSGAGKSTVAALLLGFAAPTAGRITVGGRDLAAVDSAAWRAGVGWLPQRPSLFQGTVADNIRLGRPAADDDAVRSAARLAGAEAFVDALPRGFATQVGERGSLLCAGQRQRIALARTFLVDPALLILDEPTANLDVESEAAVRAALERLAPGRTVLVIAHSPAIAATADRVVVLDHGRLDQAAPPAPAAAGGCASREAPAEPGARRDATAPRPAPGVRELVPGARGLVPARHPGGTR